MFTIQHNATSITLTDKQHAQAEIFLFGALLNRYAIQQTDGTWFNCIAGFADAANAQNTLTDGFKSAKLSPYVCRLKNGRYHFGGQSYQCHKHFIGEHAIHGLMYDAIFSVSGSDADDHSAWVELQADYAQDDAGYPFAYRMSVRYTLAENGLTLQTTVHNTGNQALPLTDGWHPYFTLGGKADDWTLHINSTQQLEFDTDLLPTGQIISDDRFQAACLLKNTQLDNSFVLHNTQQAACTLSGSQYQLRIFAEHNYPYLQIYIPPKRTSIAIENLSGAPDCFNNGMGLSILQPGQCQVFQARYVLSLMNEQ